MADSGSAGMNGAMAQARGIGICAMTPFRMGDCSAGHRGSWKLPQRGNWTADTAFAECASGCRRCSRCNYVSMSFRERECSWFHSCDLSTLDAGKRGKAEWTSALIGEDTPVKLVKSEGIELASHDVVPWTWSSRSKAPTRLFVVSGASYQWILQASRGEGLVNFVVRLLSSRCGQKRHRRDMFVDVGANDGYYGLISAALGCRVVAVEPQPGCGSRIGAAIAHNGFAARMRLVGQPLAAPPSRALSVPASGCRMVGLAQKRQESLAHEVQVNSTTLEHVVQADEGVRIALIKIDVEGAELSVIQSLLPTLARVENIVVETSPGWWTSRYNQSRAAGAELYASLLETHGFASAYTSSGIWITSARQMQRYIMSFGSSGYFSQEDVWLGRNASLMLRASEAQRERDRN